MCVPSDSNIVFHCKICNININNKDRAVWCDSCQFWIHIKCNKLNHIDYKNLEGSNDPWYYISCCDEILPFGTLTNKIFLSMVNPPPVPDDHDCFTSSSDPYISKSSSLSLKPSSNLSILFNQFNNSSPEQKTDPENVANSNYYDIGQLQTVKFPERNKPLSLFHINACSSNKNLNGLQHLLKSTNKVFDIAAVSETRIMKKTSLTPTISLNNYYFEFIPTESTAGGTHLYIANHLPYKLHNDLNLYKANQLESTFIEIINSKKSNIFVGCLYKHSVMDITDFNKNYLNSLLDKTFQGKQASFFSWRF